MKLSLNRCLSLPGQAWFVRFGWASAALVFAAMLSTARADERAFAYNYEVTTMPKGSLEYEQWVTWKNYDDRDRFEFRHEFEYGLTDNLQVALYVADWRYDNFEDGEDIATYQDTAVEFIYNLSDPIEDFIGSAIYGEIKLGDTKFVLEPKLLLQKNFGPLMAVYNFTLEAEWEGDGLDSLDENKGEIKNSAGLAYQISPKLVVGAELLHEFELEEWEEKSDDALYLGPTVSYRNKSFWITAAALFQVTGLDSEPDNQIRMLAGWNF